MHKNDITQSSRKSYPVWDRTTRLFHWVNVLCVVALATLGLAILNEKAFGVSADGKILLKSLHVYVGYVFAANLGWRILWAFVGDRHSRWKSILPLRRGYGEALRAYTRGSLAGSAPTYLGHNPLGRLMITTLLILLFTQAVTGLVLAGTDLYKPPFGAAIAGWVTGGDAEMLDRLEPGSKENVDLVAYDNMRQFRKPVVDIHLYVFYSLMILVLLHILGVVVTEIREKNGLISALFSGQKVLSEPPVDNESH